MTTFTDWMSMPRVKRSAFQAACMPQHRKQQVGTMPVAAHDILSVAALLASKSSRQHACRSITSSRGAPQAVGVNS
eukprot:1141515-Pelagomonas_calceolata.AAC.9